MHHDPVAGSTAKETHGDGRPTTGTRGGRHHPGRDRGNTRAGIEFWEGENGNENSTGKLLIFGRILQSRKLEVLIGSKI